MSKFLCSLACTWMTIIDSQFYIIDSSSLNVSLECIAIILTRRKRELVNLLLLSFRCLVTVNLLWFFLMVQWVRLLCVIVVFPDHTHLLLDNI